MSYKGTHEVFFSISLWGILVYFIKSSIVSYSQNITLVTQKSQQEPRTRRPKLVCKSLSP